MSKIPSINQPMLRTFHWFVRRYLRSHFHCLAVQRAALDAADIGPGDALLLYANHASWWDPLTAIFLARILFSDFEMFAPIDAQALARYQMFARLGFFPVDQSSLHGAANFLRTSEAILSQSGASLWVTPEGRFADVRDTQKALRPGLSHLLHRLTTKKNPNSDDSASPAAVEQRPRVWVIPCAVEYTFWEERQPELLVWIGDPLLVERSHDPHVAVRSKLQWEQELTERLRITQSNLAAASIARDASGFDMLLGGSSGSYFLYDGWRWAVGRVFGKPVRLDHSTKLN